MKNATIWESASRPLFVRSVWLESTETGRSYRHFILDYEPRQLKRQQFKVDTLASSSRRESFEQNICGEFSESDTANVSVDNLLLIAQARVEPHQQSMQSQIKQQQQKLIKRTRRASFCNKKPIEFENLHKRDAIEGTYYSRRSSLQDIQSTLSNISSNADERLAERVLNWLDLAGKTNILKIEKDSDEMDTTTHKLTKPRRKNSFASNSAHNLNINQTMPNTRPRKKPVEPVEERKRAESVKHITIIFNREGVPVRLNRPARNIDLCELSSSAGATRRLAGTLASARLYNNSTHKIGQTSAGGARHKRNDIVIDDMSKSNFHKRYHDARKQLHIFMPSLPKKGFQTANHESNDCMGIEDASQLSNNFSENCTIND